jgi:beta-ureidopropionase / N-carbamoyl-L-amino-acid hydrolase
MTVSTYQPDNVIALLEELATRTGGPEGSRRLAWTPEWLEARAYFRESLATLPVEIEQDEAGNLWAYLRGKRPETIVVGSHLDSVPKGGWLDGALGVMAGVELLRALAEEGTPECTVAVVDWADEEGARFSRSLFGSAACMGTLDIDVLKGLSDKEGNKLPDVLGEHGIDLDNLDACRTRMADVKAYIEVHIEQGPVLEAEALGIATVTGTVGIERERLIFKGQAAHAGTMPMEKRRDTLAASSRFVLSMHGIAHKFKGVATAGSIQCWPGVATAVAGETRLTLDMRHIDDGDLSSMLAEMKEAATMAGFLENCTVEWEHIFRIPPMPFHSKLRAAVKKAVRDIEDHDFSLSSGALHDASEMARGIPTAMIFCSSTAGLSHTKEEDTPHDHLRMAVDAFDRTVREAIELVTGGEL